MDLATISRALGGGFEGKALQKPIAQTETPNIFGATPGVATRKRDRSARTYMGAYGGIDAEDWVADAIGVYLSSLDAAEFHFEKNGKRLRNLDEPTDREKYPAGSVPQPLWNLITHPNPWMNFGDLMAVILIDLLLTGNAYVLKFMPNKDGQPLALYRLAPPWIEIESDKDKIIAHYLYKPDGQSKVLKYEPQEIIHFKLPNPHDDALGLGLIAQGPRIVDLDLALVETMAQFFEHGAKLSGVVETDRSVPDPIIQKVRRQFNSIYSIAAHGAWQVAVLERGLKFQSIQPTAAEAQFAELSKMGRDRVFSLMKVHPALVNGDTARPGLLEEVQRFFDNKTFKPMLKKMALRISAELTQAWEIDFKFDYEYVMPEKDRLTLAAVFSSIPGVMVREVREYVKLPPLGDERDDIVLNLPGLSTDQGGPANTAHPVTGGRPGHPENTAPFPQAPGAGVRQSVPRQAAVAPKPGGNIKATLAEVKELIAKVEAERDAAWDIKWAMDDAQKLPKAQRQEAFPVVVEPHLQKLEATVAERVRATVAEGARRGYTTDQIFDGYPEEKFEGLRGTLGLGEDD